MWRSVRCRKLVYIRAAGPLTVTVLSIAICNIFHLNRAPYNIRVVGTVPAVRRLSAARLGCPPEVPCESSALSPHGSSAAHSHLHLPVMATV